MAKLITPFDETEGKTLAPPKPEEWHPIHDIPKNSVVYEIQQFLYAQSHRQNLTIASVAAIALWAGIVGRNVNVSGEGLNQYVLLVAGTGRGKETISKGIGKIIEAIAQTVPEARNLVSGRFASSQAILQHLQNFPATLSIQAEGEYLFRRITSPKASQNEQDVLQTLLDLYHKSGFQASMPGYRKARVEESVGSIASPCFTLVTESTFGAVDALLAYDSVKKGFTPRFLIVMTKADRPYDNPSASEVRLDPYLVEKLAGWYCATKANSNPLRGVNVTFSPEAEDLHNCFDRETTDLMNMGGDRPEGIIWNRSHLKALKLAASIAAGINPYCPHIEADVMRWAIKVERHNVEQLLAEMESGEVGESTEDVRLGRVTKAFADYVLTEHHLLSKGYRVSSDLHERRIVAFTYLHNKLGNTAPFRKNGYKEPRDLIRDSLKVLVEKGDLIEINKVQMFKETGHSVEGWMIGNPRSFGL
ncbi:DUF3987 domain-containing protein [Roseovarius sp. 217]|uniref:DUF3987 domain-containing protein n=1 Tax=Roseovarius sp. (strain 217) TaxID=314264 RepID=UPI0000685B1D|nr:DUF3987 domain-containing protein [Roseovarius sp. 217]EAQ26702.1 hypothetical protein ROS217_19287 [Roseovarius sp. 217]